MDWNKLINDLENNKGKSADTSFSLHHFKQWLKDQKDTGPILEHKKPDAEGAELFEEVKSKYTKKVWKRVDKQIEEKVAARKRKRKKD
jgi:UDP-galactopyranose mutase